MGLALGLVDNCIFFVYRNYIVCMHEVSEEGRIYEPTIRNPQSGRSKVEKDSAKDRWCGRKLRKEACGKELAKKSLQKGAYGKELTERSLRKVEI